MILKCIAIDDEPLALDIIEDYSSKIESIELVGKLTSAIKAIKIIKTNPIDLIFLDIQMPELSGFEFLDTLNKRPMVIFTSAYDDYAVDSYNYNAVDYLLKPFSFSRFLKAVEKAHEFYFESTTKPLESDAGLTQDFIFVNADGGIVKVFLDDILYLKGLSDYIEMHTKEKRFIIRENLKDAEKLLGSSNFLRVHKSFIIPVDKIEKIEGNMIFIANETIPIGRIYRSALMKMVKSFKIG